MGYIQIIGYILGLYRDNGKENGNYYSIMGYNILLRWDSEKENGNYYSIMGYHILLYWDNGKENGGFLGSGLREWNNLGSNRGEWKRTWKLLCYVILLQGLYWGRFRVSGSGRRGMEQYGVLKGRMEKKTEATTLLLGSYRG